MHSILPGLTVLPYARGSSTANEAAAATQDSNAAPVSPLRPIRESVSISPESRQLYEQRAVRQRQSSEQSGRPASDGLSSNPEDQLDFQLSEEEQRQLRELQARDREVRAHEQAHLAAAGTYARGGASYTYQKGPDGRNYAIGGEVAIDIAKEATPEATIVKMQTVRRAALAPAEPSAADRSIASQATQRLTQAQRELQSQKSDELQEQGFFQTGAGIYEPSNSDSTSSVNGAKANQRAMVADVYRAADELF